MNKNAIKRIITKDIKSINEKQIEKNGIYIHFDENDILKAHAMVIGPKDTIYEGGILLFSISFPKNYPYVPPKISYIKENNIRIHPNIYVNGKICLSILGTWSGPSWSSMYDISDVFITIQSLLNNNPIIHEPGYSDLTCSKNKLINNSYNSIIKYNTINSLILNRYFKFKNEYIDTVFNSFTDIAIKHVETIKENIKNRCDIDNNKNTYVINFKIYNINLKIDYLYVINKYHNCFKL